jgi:hypothetical protein
MYRSYEAEAVYSYLEVAFQGTDMEDVEVVTRQSYKVIARVGDGNGAQHTYTATPSSQLRDQSQRKDAYE